jgi:hypothetical protein
MNPAGTTAGTTDEDKSAASGARLGAGLFTLGPLCGDTYACVGAALDAGSASG